MYLATFEDYTTYGFKLSQVCLFRKRPTKTQLVKALCCHKSIDVKSTEFKSLSKEFSIEDFYIERVELIENA